MPEKQTDNAAIDPDMVRAAVIGRTAERLQRYTSRPALLRFFTGRGPEAMWVVEFAAADTTSFMCSGAKVRAWAVTAGGVKAVHPDDVDTGAVTGRMWQRPMTGFWIAPDATVYVNEMEGPKYGTLVRFAVKAQAASEPVQLKRIKAVLLMHGTLVG